jgi:hypothetical protein
MDPPGQRGQRVIQPGGQLRGLPTRTLKPPSSATSSGPEAAATSALRFADNVHPLEDLPDDEGIEDVCMQNAVSRRRTKRRFRGRYHGASLTRSTWRAPSSRE